MFFQGQQIADRLDRLLRDSTRTISSVGAELGAQSTNRGARTRRYQRFLRDVGKVLDELHHVAGLLDVSLLSLLFPEEAPSRDAEQQLLDRLTAIEERLTELVTARTK